MLKAKILNIIISMIVVATFVLGITPNVTYAATQKISTDISGIDDSKYPGIKSMIQALQKAHPNWNFKVLYTGLDWEDVIDGETSSHGKNLIGANQSKYSGDWICKTCGTSTTYSGGNWLCVSDEAVEYMMDPRNSLYYADVFQFLELSYDESTTYSESAIKAILEDTFMDDGNLNTYVKTIISACKTYDVNPYYVAVKIIQEQGTSGGSTFKMTDSSSSSSNIEVEDNIITAIPGTTASEVLSYLESSYTIKNNSGKEIKSTDSVGTGYTVGDDYTMVVLGDVNGDGKVKAADYMTIKNYIMGSTKLDTYQKLAADVNSDDKVKAADYMTIKNYIMGSSEINLNGTTYYYNIFNINATGSTTSTIVKNALSYAKNKGWTTIEKCLTGGIEFISSGYISVGQDTMYFEKFNVVNKTYYSHQYAQDVMYAQNQGTSFRKVLESISATEYSYTFVIPLYENMPSSACARPATN